MTAAIEVLQRTLDERRTRRQHLEHHHSGGAPPEREKLESDRTLAELTQAIQLLKHAKADPAV